MSAAGSLRLTGHALLSTFVASTSAQLPVDHELDWWQWGGPHRQFVISSPSLEQRWLDRNRPVELFRRELLGGQSAVAFAGGRIFVLHGKARSERVTVLSPGGDVLWEKEYREKRPCSACAIRWC